MPNKWLRVEYGSITGLEKKTWDEIRNTIQEDVGYNYNHIGNNTWTLIWDQVGPIRDSIEWIKL